MNVCVQPVKSNSPVQCNISNFLTLWIEVSGDPGNKLSRLKAELYQKMDLEDFSKKFSLLKADMDRNMDQHMVRHRLEVLRSELNRMIQNQHELKAHLDSAMADFETFKQETNVFFVEQKRVQDNIKVELHKTKAQVTLANHKSIRSVLLSLFSVIAAGLSFMFSFE